MIKVKVNDIKISKGKTNWSHLKNQTDAEINNAALSDKDARLLKDHELLDMKKPNK